MAVLGLHTQTHTHTHTHTHSPIFCICTKCVRWLGVSEGRWMELNNSSVKANEPAPLMTPLSTTYYSALVIQKQTERARGIVNLRHWWTTMYCMYLSLSSIGSKTSCAVTAWLFWHNNVKWVCLRVCACLFVCLRLSLVCGRRRPTRWSSSLANKSLNRNVTGGLWKTFRLAEFRFGRWVSGQWAISIGHV